MYEHTEITLTFVIYTNIYANKLSLLSKRVKMSGMITTAKYEQALGFTLKSLTIIFKSQNKKQFSTNHLCAFARVFTCSY